MTKQSKYEKPANQYPRWVSSTIHGDIVASGPLLAVHRLEETNILVREVVEQLVRLSLIHI